MDKKWLGIISAMLMVCILLAAAAAMAPEPDKSDSAASKTANSDYVDKIFDKDKVLQIELTLGASDFNDMMENPTAEEYKPATVAINGRQAETVGFRVKGNSSLMSIAQSSSKRFSFKVDFNQYIDGQNLYGLTKLNLNNSFSDPSYMREYLSYGLLEEMGIMPPACCYANVYVNGELLGLYLAVEGIEEPFLERCYGSDYGNLYKPEGSGADLVYTGDNMASYSGIAPVTDLKSGAGQSLLSMLKALNQGQNPEQYLDVDEILRYFAVNTVLVNMDSYLGSFKHNYYLYEQNGVFSILPWDYNMSFGGFGEGGGAISNQGSTGLAIDQPVQGASLEQRPLLGKLLEVPEYKELYHQYINEFVNGPFSSAKMEAEIERVAALIRPYLEQDPTKFYSMEQFEQAIAEGAQSDTEPALEGASPQVQAISPAALSEAPALFEQGDAARPGRPQSDIMMSGNSKLGLSKFVRERIDNVKKQLSGELPSVVNEAAQSKANPVPGQWGDGQNRVMPPEGGPQPPGFKGNRPADWPARGEDAGTGPGGEGPNLAGSGRPDLSIRQMYVAGGSLLLLTMVTALLLRKKNRHSI